MATSNGKVNASLFGISDSEILHMVDDVADENGWATTYDVRLQLGENVEEPRSGVPTRLSWLRRFGWLERGESRKLDDMGHVTATWRLTAMGHTLLDNPSLNKSLERTLSRLTPAQRLTLTRELGEAGHAAAPEIATALRRQWTRSSRGYSRR